ncbi:hypothetical protein C8R45DRAFT_1136051 [Mycena sanguinolenta]|nr:hypothetical protein C8R45DRAFT_1136051 [Mycena sanguinolenta]
MPFVLRQGRKRRASDADYTPSPSVAKRLKQSQPTRDPSPPALDESDGPLPPSSTPGSPIFWNDNNQPITDNTPIRPPSPFELDLPPLPPSPELESPPTSPSGGPLTSPFRLSPEKRYGAPLRGWTSARYGSGWGIHSGSLPDSLYHPRSSHLPACRGACVASFRVVAPHVDAQSFRPALAHLSIRGTFVAVPICARFVTSVQRMRSYSSAHGCYYPLVLPFPSVPHEGTRSALPGARTPVTLHTAQLFARSLSLPSSRARAIGLPEYAQILIRLSAHPFMVCARSDGAFGHELVGIPYARPVPSHHATPYMVHLCPRSSSRFVRSSRPAQRPCDGSPYAVHLCPPLLVDIPGCLVSMPSFVPRNVCAFIAPHAAHLCAISPTRLH